MSVVPTLKEGSKSSAMKSDPISVTSTEVAQSDPVPVAIFSSSKNTDMKSGQASAVEQAENNSSLVSLSDLKVVLLEAWRALSKSDTQKIFAYPVSSLLLHLLFVICV